MSIATRTIAVALVTAAATAQCQFGSLSSQSAGTVCNFGPTGCCAVPSWPSQLAPGLDTAACAMSCEVLAFEGC